MNCEQAEYLNLELTIVDTGRADLNHFLYIRHFIENKNGIIYIIDASDIERVRELKNELQKTLSNSIGIPLVVMANKQEIIGALSVEEIIELLDLNSITDRKWSVIGTSMVKEKGFKEGLDWLIQRMK